MIRAELRRSKEDHSQVIWSSHLEPIKTFNALITTQQNVLKRNLEKQTLVSSTIHTQKQGASDLSTGQKWIPYDELLEVWIGHIHYANHRTSTKLPVWCLAIPTGPKSPATSNDSNDSKVRMGGRELASESFNSACSIVAIRRKMKSRSCCHLQR